MEEKFKCVQCGFESSDAIDFMRAVDVDLPDTLCNDCAEKIVGKQEKEFDLSKKIACDMHNLRWIPVDDIKEFIKIILEEEFEEWIKGCVCKDGVWTIYNADFTAFKERIKKRAGEKLR